MAKTLLELQTSLAYKLGESAAPSTSGIDWVQRRDWFNEAIRDWRDRYDWSDTLLISQTLETTADQNYVNLPSDMRKFGLAMQDRGYLEIGGDRYTLITRDQYLRQSSGNKYVYLDGNVSDGFKLFINPIPDAVYEITPFDYYTKNVCRDNAGDPAESLSLSSDYSIIPNDLYLI